MINTMLQALKDRLGMTEAVEQVKERLEEEYDNYPEGIMKIRLNTNDKYKETVNVHLERPYEWNVMEDVADDMGLEPEYEKGGNWFGFYGTDEHGIRTLVGHVRNDRPELVKARPYDETEDFWFEVLVRYLNKRYSEKPFDKNVNHK